MDSAFVNQLLYANIFAQFRTGHTFLDMLIVMAIMTFTSYISLLQFDPKKWLKKDVTKVQVRPSNMENRQHQLNWFYYAFEDQFGKLNPQSESFEINVTPDNQKSYRPSEGALSVINYEGCSFKVRKIVIVPQNDQRNVQVQTYLEFEFHSSIQSTFDRFVSHVLEMDRMNKRKYAYVLSNVMSGSGVWKRCDFDSSKTLDTIIMAKERKEELRKDVQNFKKNKDLYIKRGMPYKRGYLFYGETGCGKTSLIKALIKEFGMDVYIVKLNALEDVTSFEMAFNSIPKDTIVVFEDIDTTDIMKTREESLPEPPQANYNNENASPIYMDPWGYSTSMKKNTNKPDLSMLLNELDGLLEIENRITIMTTNRIDNLDSALIRPGRIDVKMELKRATLEEIQMCYDLFDVDLKDQHLDESVSGVYTVADVCNYIACQVPIPKPEAELIRVEY